ncbi:MULTISPECIES: TPM domain-containing protein [Lactobacillus]|uniref:TPM domain-containing protein n=1 Tax=Lactobacillus xujianguonis TaxID=2495899 RepID=A0A437STZ2_9LACO|nr:TPM domain-containing protein [Lactobacillus xujianguonis]
MLKVWHTIWKKPKTKILISLLALGTIFLTMSAFVQPNISDNANLLDRQTRQLIQEKNNRYWQTKEQPQIAVITVKRLNKLTPRKLNATKRICYIVVGAKGKKRNVQIFSSKDLHGAFTADTRMNILRAAANDLRSPQKATFNKGLRLVFRACATKIDQQYQYAFDKYDLTNEEQDRISHPHRVALPLALALAVIVMALIYFLGRVRKQKND